MDQNNLRKGLIRLATKQFRTLKKHTKLKMVVYIRCEPPYYDKKEIKKITAHIRYEPLFKWRTKIDYTLEHMKYSDSKKYRTSYMTFSPLTD